MARYIDFCCRPAAFSNSYILGYAPDRIFAEPCQPFGITLVVGILVDDAIVEIENIVRHIRMGKTPYRASLEAADEIGLAVIAISVTIIAIFAPVSFMSGVAGQYFKQFGLTVAIAVFFSLLVARLITPMMAAYFMREPKHHDESHGFFMRGYMSVLRQSVRHRWITLIGGILFFAGSLYAMGFLPSGFIPKIDVARVITSLELPPGSSLEQTRQITDRASAELKEIPEVKRVYVIGGVSPTGTLEKRRATLIVELFHKSERETTQAEIEPKILAVLSRIPTSNPISSMTAVRANWKSASWGLILNNFRKAPENCRPRWRYRAVPRNNLERCARQA